MEESNLLALPSASMEPRDEDQELCSGMALANYYLKGPTQSLEFVAKVLWCRREYMRIRPFTDGYGQAILATPLYVAQTEIMLEDDDNQGRHAGTDKYGV